MSKPDGGPAFTKAELFAFRAYEKVRTRGRFNMFDPRARRETGLSADRYSFVMKHYTELRDAIIAEGKK